MPAPAAASAVPEAPAVPALTAPRPVPSQPWTTDALRPVWTRWYPGPAPDGGEPVVLSLTEYTADRLRDVPGIVRTGLRLAQGWYAMPGAVGLLLYSQPLALRTGSLSVWRSEEDLRRFVGLPLHLETMRRFRTRGRLRATQWEMESFDLPTARAHGELALAG